MTTSWRQRKRPDRPSRHGRVYAALRARHQPPLKQRDVAREFDVSPSVIGQIEGGFIPVPGDTDDQREDWWRRKERKLERPFLDELLALGDRRSRGSEPLYALGLLHEDRKRRRKELSFPEEPPAALRDRDAADAVADLLYALGLREVVVAPVWPDFIREVLDGPEAVSAHETELTRLIDSRQTVPARGAARAGQSRRSPQPI